MPELAWPWALAAVLLPVVVARWAPRAMPTRGEALRFPLVDQLEALATLKRPARRGWRQWAAGLAWCLLVLAAARPQAVGEPFSVPATGRDMVLAVDLSSSMQTRDLRLDGVPMTRLAGIQRVMGEFIERRDGDRIGLVFFGTKPFLQTPLTFDRTTVGVQLAEALIGMAGGHTALGDVIGLVVKRFTRSDAQRQVLILVSDGANTAGETHPLDAADIALARGLIIHTVGVGSELSAEQERILGPASHGRSLDEATLRAVAARTGGHYLRGDDWASLNAIYTELDRLEPVARPGDMVRPVQEYYPWPLACSLVLAMLVLMGDRVESSLRVLRQTLRVTIRRWLSSSS